MSTSQLQEPFLKELVDTFRATSARIIHRLSDATQPDSKVVVDDELRGLYHGLLVIFDGGTSLADQGLISISDEDGILFDRHLHEIGLSKWPQDDPFPTAND